MTLAIILKPQIVTNYFIYSLKMSDESDSEFFEESQILDLSSSFSDKLYESSESEDEDEGILHNETKINK